MIYETFELHCYILALFLHLVNIGIGLESTTYPVVENFGEVVVCVTIQKVTITCAIGFPFSVILSTTDGSAGINLKSNFTFKNTTVSL